MKGIYCSKGKTTIGTFNTSIWYKLLLFTDDDDNVEKRDSEFEEADKNYKPPLNTPKRKRDSLNNRKKKKAILIPEVCLNYDRTPTSDGKSIRIVTPIISASEQDPNNFIYSKETYLSKMYAKVSNIM